MKNKEAKELMSRFKAGESSENEQIKISYWLHHFNEDGDSGLSEEDLQHASDDIWTKVDPAKIKLKTRKTRLRNLPHSYRIL